MEHLQFVTLVTLLLATLSPLVLKYAPADWNGARMALVALAVSVVLGGVDLWVTGQFANFTWQTAALTLTAYIGAQQGFYALLKDRLQLADPTPTALH
jgi:hypothetical protein